MLTPISGTFVKIAYASEVELMLARGMASRPAARFNRRGQDALYLSPDEASARVAMGQYVKAGDPPRVLLTYEVGCCRVVDLRHEEAGAIRAQAEQPWLAALARGEEPASWRAADEVRGLGAVGLVDPSRRQPGLWHVTLFRWNEPGAPAVIPVGRALPLEIVPVPGS